MSNETLESFILKSLDLPAIPMVAAKVMQLLDTPGASLVEVQEIVSADPAVTSRLLRIANSPFYGGGKRQIDSVQAAVMTMGFETVKNMVLSASIRQVYKHFGLFEKMSWEHSLGVSIAAGMLAPRYGIKAEEAATAGLLHDLGKVVINNKSPDAYARIVETVYDEHLPVCALEKEEFGFDHCQVGAVVARNWKLSPGFETMMAFHNYPEEIPEVSEEQRGLCRLIFAADAVCRYLGVGLREPTVDALDGVDLPDEELMQFMENFKEVFVTEKLKFMDA